MKGSPHTLGGPAMAHSVASVPWAVVFGRSAAVEAAGLFVNEADEARIFFYQPLFAELLTFVVFGYVFAKVRRAQDARDARLLAEVEIKKLLSAQLAGEQTSATKLEALEAELEVLRSREEAESELVGFGEETPTSRRFSLGIRPPPTDVSRAYSSLVEPRAPREATSSSTEESNAEILALLVGFTLFTLFLLYVSG